MSLTEEMKKYHRDWYHRQSDERKTKKVELQRNRRKIIAIWIQEYKEFHGCFCGEKDPRCLDFHHLGHKLDNVANLVGRGFSKENLLKEIAKCKILCANCHRKETFREV